MIKRATDVFAVVSTLWDWCGKLSDYSGYKALASFVSSAKDAFLWKPVLILFKRKHIPACKPQKNRLLCLPDVRGVYVYLIEFFYFCNDKPLNTLPFYLTMTVNNILSAFRTEQQMVQQVFAGWKMNLQQLNTRSEVPFELAYRVAENSDLQFRLFFTSRPLWVTLGQQPVSEPYEVLSAAEMLVRFGIEAIEETIERSVAKVRDKVLGTSIQVINSLKVTEAGVFAWLRTERPLSLLHKQVRSAGTGCLWKVAAKPLSFPAYAGAIKLEQQQQQGIVLYILEPVSGREKPAPGEILFW